MKTLVVKIIFGIIIAGVAVLLVLTVVRETKKTPSSAMSEDEIVSGDSPVLDENTGEEIVADGDPTAPDQASPTGKYSLYVWGNNDVGQLGMTSGAKKTPIAISVPDDVKAIYSGETFSAMLSSSGKVYTWGDTQLNQLGVFDVISKKLSLVKTLPAVTAISASYRHTLALDAKGNVYAWGSNYTGQIGDGSNNNPHAIFKVPNLPTITDIAAGYKFSIVAAKDGSVYAWGASCPPYDKRLLENFASALQQGTSSYYDPVISSRIRATLQEDCKNEDTIGLNTKVPKKLDGISNVVQVSAGYGHGLMLKKDGTVWSFGCNLYGQLGNRGTQNSPANSLVLQVPSLEKVQKIAAGFRHSLALTKDGTVYMWGGSLARDAADDVRVLANRDIIKVAGLPKITDIIAGKDYSIAIGEDGKMYGWGNNTFNVISPESTVMITRPIEIKLPIKPRVVGTGSDFITVAE